MIVNTSPIEMSHAALSIIWGGAAVASGDKIRYIEPHQQHVINL
jgi:hypothetical protein